MLVLDLPERELDLLDLFEPELCWFRFNVSKDVL